MVPDWRGGCNDWGRGMGAQKMAGGDRLGVIGPGRVGLFSLVRSLVQG